ncbi:MAG: DUF72 domain-containing protein [Actinomycetota bacterium]|nr:DUF72 domain-containing protein [Actinomycetota bacterium]
MSPGRARVGCSGWSYADWRGPVYPVDTPQRRWFETYARSFDTVELNATFYRLPNDSTVRGWRAAAPDGFTYAVKVGQFGTHRKKLNDPTTWLNRHLERVALLGPSLGPQLVQLPPRWRRNTARLDEFLDAAPVHLRWAIEFRDPSWLTDDVFEVLARHGAALCWHDLLPSHPWERTAPFTYVRLHGPHALDRPYFGRYGARRLHRLADRLLERLAIGDDVYAYFNNDQQAAAVHDARQLRGLITQTSPGSVASPGPDHATAGAQADSERAPG